MKSIATLRLHSVVLAVTSALCLPAAALVTAGAATTETEYPCVLQPELGATEFAPGDGIVITALRGNRPHLEPGGRYLLEGTYTLASAPGGKLAWFSTSRGPSGPTPIGPGEQVSVSNGSGNFRLEKTLAHDGWLHVSFYVHGESHGGIYFGEKGLENTVLRKKGWSDFPGQSAGNRRKTEASGRPGLMAAPANRAIMAYLGNPVPPPANLDPIYSPSNLLTAFGALSRQTGSQVRKVAVDDSEFPFLVYGLLAGRQDYQVIEKGLSEMKDYEYGGSVTGSTERNYTYFALDMIPARRFPAGQTAACNRRLMVRLQMLADAAQSEE